jgi:hypothetical protein
MELRAYHVETAEQARPFRTVLLRALREIGARSGGDLPPEQELALVVSEISDPQNFALWLSIDHELLAQGKPVNEAVVGMMTLSLRQEAGTLVAWIMRGWSRPGYHGAVFDQGLPIAVGWARRRGASKLRTMTERSSAAVARPPGRFDPKNLRARLAGLLAYARWIHRRGFRMRVTVFEMDLAASAAAGHERAT